LTTSELAAKVSATDVPPKTAIIDLAVTDDSADRAQLIANTLANEFISYADALETPTGEDAQKVHTKVITAATEPRMQRAQPIFLGVLVVAAAALLAGIAVWIRARLDPTVRSTDQAATAAGVPVLGSVPSAPPDTSAGLQHYHSLRVRLRPMFRSALDDHRGQVITMASATGELDPMAIASGLGRAFELSGSRSVVLDAGSAAADHTSGGPAASERDREGLPDSVSVTDWVAESDQLTPKIAADFIDKLRSDYEVVLVAAPAVLLSADAVTMAEQSDVVLLALSPDTTRRRDVAQAVDRLRAHAAPLCGTVFARRQSDGESRKGRSRVRRRLPHLDVLVLECLTMAGAVGMFWFKQISEHLPQLR
jgi:Mrp family chromosome partitioning ATPase